MLKPVEKIKSPWVEPSLTTTDYSDLVEGDIIVVERRVARPYAFRSFDTFWVTAQIVRATKTQRTILCLGRETVVTLKGKIVGAGSYDRLPRLTEEGQKKFDHTASDYAYVRLTHLRNRIRAIQKKGSLANESVGLKYLCRAANEGIVDEELMGAVERVIDILNQRAEEAGDE